ncbi:hypothetical protein [Nitrobacter sp. TKz-YC01]|uniref:hypothetical protein n=1 Tax=Nitrobacter sp. TKz-YC01 TaxID=3398703 RepID=UPI003A102E52
MNGLVPSYAHIRRGIELGFFRGRCGRPLIYDGTEPVAIDAQAGKGKLTRFLGVNMVSPRTAHLTKIITDPKDAELAWVSWKTLERQGYRVRFINPGRLYGYPSESYNFNTRLLEIASKSALRPLVWEAAYDAASYLVPVDPNPHHKWIGQGVRTAFALYNKITALYPSERWPCTVGGLWDFFGRNSFDPADMKRAKTALFIIGSACSDTSRNFVGAMAAAVIERFADAHGPLRALVVGEE